MIRDYSRKSDPKIHLIYCIDVGRYVGAGSYCSR